MSAPKVSDAGFWLEVKVSGSNSWESLENYGKGHKARASICIFTNRACGAACLWSRLLTVSGCVNHVGLTQLVLQNKG